MRTFVLSFALLSFSAAAAPPGAELESLWQDLRAGGNVLFLRHPEASVGNDVEGPPDCDKH